VIKRERGNVRREYTEEKRRKKEQQQNELFLNIEERALEKLSKQVGAGVGAFRVNKMNEHEKNVFDGRELLSSADIYKKKNKQKYRFII